MSKYFDRLKNRYKSSNRKSIIVYFLLRILVIACMVLQLVHGDIINALLCILTLVLFTLPGVIQFKLKITLPSMLEIIIYLFIFSAEILGEINNFYCIVPHWDTILHTINGFITAGIGFSLVDILNEKVEQVHLSPFFVAVVGFCFSMTIGVMWEFCEFAIDNFLYIDMQKDEIVTQINTVYLNENNENKVVRIKDIAYTIVYNSDGEPLRIIENGYLDIGLMDTMEDLLVNFIGAITFSLIGYLYNKNKDKYGFINNFIPKKAKNENKEVSQSDI